ncbi:MAG: FkbM family methyltransferase [Rhodanobacteraceae bacterium]
MHGDLPSRPRDGAQATDDDIYYAYRLLLGREPDAKGWDELRRIVASRSISPEEIARGFLSSPEFAVRNNGLSQVGALVEVPLDGFKLYVRANDRDIGRQIQSTRIYEPHVTRAMSEILRTDDVFVDVGANIGFFTNLAAHLVGPRGFVLAIEAMDKNVQLILRSLECNGFAHVRVLACAASDRDGRVAMRTDPGTSNGQAVAAGAFGERTLYAQALRIDELARGLAKIDLVKLDIEGFELLAWRGFRDSLARHRPRVLSEFHPYCMRQFVDVEPAEYLAELFAYGGAIDVVHTDGARARCDTPDDVMREWESVNARANAAGTPHLDLLVQPRT